MRKLPLIATAVGVLILVPVVALAAGGTAPDTYTPPCTANTDACRQQRIVALENHYKQHVHPSPLPSTSATPTPSVTATVSSTPTPSATATSASPTPTSTSTAGGFPSASDTGVPAGTSLTASSGDMTITTANAVVDAKDINGCVIVKAPGVTIKRSKVHCSSGYAVYSEDGTWTGTPLTIQDSEIDCKSSGATAVGEANVTALRIDIHGCENGFDVNQNIIVRDSYIHDMYQSAAAHTDGIQFAGGHFVNGQIVPASLNVTIEHNRIYANDGTSAIISNRGGDTNVLIQNNLMAGGAATLYCEQGAKGINYRVINNRISTIFYPTGGAYMPWTDCEDEDISGNVWHESGLPLPTG